MAGQSSAQDILSKNGYNGTGGAYQVGAAPSTTGQFNGYQAQNAQAANINASGGQPYADMQQTLAGQLAQQASGQGGPSLAQQQLQSGVNANLASALAAGVQRGNQNAGMQERDIQQNMANINAQGAGQAAQVRAQEQMNAQNQLAGVTGQGISQAAQQAQLSQQATLANQGAQNTAGQFNSQAQQNLAGLNQQNYALQQTIGSQQQTNYNQALANLSNIGQNQSNSEMNAAVQTGTNVAGDALKGLAALSDENEKTDIQPVDTSGMLEAMHASAYRYKDPSAPGAAPGMHVGPMAQELERDPVGATTVVQNPDGTKGVDTGRLALTLAGALAQMHERVNALEKKKSK